MYVESSKVRIQERCATKEEGEVEEVRIRDRQ